jgi:hypothetical protein
MTTDNPDDCSTFPARREYLVECLRHGVYAGGDDLAYDLQELLLDAVTAVRASYLGDDDNDVEASVDASAVALANVATLILHVARLDVRTAANVPNGAQQREQLAKELVHAGASLADVQSHLGHRNNHANR